MFQIILHKLSNPLFILLLSLSGVQMSAQPGNPPIPAEVFLGHDRLYSQIVVKRKFTAESKLSIFNMATYTADYQNEPDQNSLVMINQISYNLSAGFGFMGGTDMNSAVGFSPIIGPQHNFVSREFLVVTVLSFFLKEDNDAKLFGLYEYKPSLGNAWSLYNRIQFIYNHNLSEGTHNRSYLYLRTGLKKNSIIFGLAANLDRYGPQLSTHCHFLITCTFPYVSDLHAHSNGPNLNLPIHQGDMII